MFCFSRLATPRDYSPLGRAPFGCQWFDGFCTARTTIRETKIAGARAINPDYGLVGYQLIREEFSVRDREVFEALVFAGRKSAEIAKERGISVGALHKVRSRIVGRLRRFLADLE